MSELELVEQQVADDMDPKTFLSLSVMMIEKYFQPDQAKEYVDWLSEGEPDQETLSSKMMSIALNLSDERKDQFVKTILEVLEQQQ
jgi:hypothetical protein